MQQALDFLEESEALAKTLTDLPETAWGRVTQFKDWTVEDVLVHLYFWNKAADWSLTDPDRFEKLIGAAFSNVLQGSLRTFENETIFERGESLFDAWTVQFREIGHRFATVDPKTRVKWAGPDMSVRSSITARQMETWAHGQAIFDLLGIERETKDRIHNIVVLGINTFEWSHTVQGLDCPDAMPRLSLESPSGELWSFGDPNAEEEISGLACEFAQVVTQTRSIEDTNLKMTGPVARLWMKTAQCFAGPREAPPKPGSRFVAV